MLQSHIFLKRKVLDSSKLKVFADDNFEFYKNSKMFPERIENAVGKGEIARYEQFLLFPQCFQKTCSAVHVKNQVLFGKG